jgi:anti-anti-sigma factor
MSAQRFHGAIRQRDGAAVLDLSGDIDGDAEQPLRDAYHEAVARSPATVVLNFAEVTYINSTGIALIVGLLARARATGLDVRAYGLTPHYREIFEITRLADFVAINPDEDSAVRGAEGSTNA